MTLSASLRIILRDVVRRGLIIREVAGDAIGSGRGVGEVRPAPACLIVALKAILRVALGGVVRRGLIIGQMAEDAVGDRS